MTTYTEASDSGGLLVSFLWLVIIFACIFFAVVTLSHADNPLTSVSDASSVRNQCKPNSFFAEASDYEGNIIHFCMLYDGGIGVIKYHNGKLVDADVIDSNINFRQLLDYIHSLDENLRLVRFDSGFIPAP